MPQSIYLEKGIEDKYDMEELFDRVLKVDNIEALTVVAKELKEADFQRLLKAEFPEPTVPNLLIESTLRKFYFHDC